MEWFSDEVEDDELYQLVKEQNNLIQQRMRHLNINIHKKMVHKASLYLIILSEEEKQQLKIDQVLSIYLIDVAEHVIVNFYKTMAVFVGLYRSCLNEIGWDKLANFKRLGPLIKEVKDPKDEQENFDDMLPPFSIAKDAQSIPELSNEFILDYLPVKCPLFERKLAITLVDHLCMWLYNRKLTNVKVSMLS